MTKDKRRGFEFKGWRLLRLLIFLLVGVLYIFSLRFYYEEALREVDLSKKSMETKKPTTAREIFCYVAACDEPK